MYFSPAALLFDRLGRMVLSAKLQKSILGSGQEEQSEFEELCFFNEKPGLKASSGRLLNLHV